MPGAIEGKRIPWTPSDDQSQSNRSPMERSKPDMTETTVLVVDDEEDLANLYTATLATKYSVRTATSGAEAIEMMDEEVAVVLLDRRMPGMTGDDVLSTLRERGYDCQIAMLTAVEPDGRIIEMPFDDYRVKPIEENDLLKLVDVLLERAAFDEQCQEFFRLASKKAALEVAGNDDIEEYHHLVKEMEIIRAEIEATLDRIGDEAAYKELNSGKA